MTHTHDTCTRNLSYLSPVCLQVQFMCEYIFSKRANIFYGITFYDKKWIISYWHYLRMSHIEHTPCAISSLINTWHSSANCLSGRCTVNCCLQRNIYLIRKHVAKIFHSNSTWMSHKKKRSTRNKEVWLWRSPQAASSIWLLKTIHFSYNVTLLWC